MMASHSTQPTLPAQPVLPGTRLGRAKATQLLRYAAGVLGPASVAAVQFAVSALLLHALAPSEFGLFSFLMIVIFLSSGISSALLCSTFAFALRDGGGEPGRVYLSANLVLSLAVGMGIGLLAVGLGETNVSAALFGVLAFLMMLRWFARAYSYAMGSPYRAFTSDLIYSGVATGSLAFIAMTRGVTVDAALIALATGAALALPGLGWGYLKRQFIDIRPSALKEFRGVWRAHGRWALLGVVTTEATVNAQAYLVVMVAGPGAYAPIAAAALFMRPLNLVMNALADVERPRIARLLANRLGDGAIRTLMAMRGTLAAAWLASAAGSIALLTLWPSVINAGTYDTWSILVAVLLWSAVFALRCVRVPESIMMQAAGAFRSLALASALSSIFSLSASAALLFAAGPIASLGGAVLGEAVFLVATALAFRAWKRSAMAPAGETS